MKKEKPKTERAAALKYDGINAPKLIAKGQGSIAREIIEKAREHKVHIHNDPILLEVLGRLELGDEIPRELYLAVAKIIAFAYFLQGKHPDAANKDSASSGDTHASLSAESEIDRYLE